VETVRISAKGQVVIPKRVREQAGLHEGTLCAVEIRREGVLLRPTRPASGWRRWEGVLAGTPALRDHLDDHRQEVAGDRDRP
jgi:AbrB family looped-hinge helix DNA binding protein